MSTTTSEGATAPEGTTTSTPQGQAGTAGATPPPQAPAAPASPPAAPPRTEDPAWLASRLEQARRAVLTELGVQDIADARTAIAAEKQRRDAAKTLEERLAAAEADRERLTARTTQLEASARIQADAALSRLTTDQRAAVERLSGTDPARVLDTIAALSPTWGAPAAPAAPATPPAAPAAPPAAAPPADTAPPRTAPAGVTTSPVDRAAEYERLSKTNPFAASRYLAAYRHELFPEQQRNS